MLKPEQLQADIYMLHLDPASDQDIEDITTLEDLAETNRIFKENGIPVNEDYGDDLNWMAERLGIIHDDTEVMSFDNPPPIGGNNNGQ